MKTVIKTLAAISAIILTGCTQSSGFIMNGEDGKSCSVTKNTATDIEMTCGNDSVSIPKGTKGDKGDAGKDGESCSVIGETSSEVEIICGNNSVKVPKGTKGDKGDAGKDGSSCLVMEKTSTEVEIICGNDSVIIPKGTKGDKGKDGKDGADCSVADDGAYFVMVCGEGSESRWAKAMCGVNAYDPAYKFCDFRDGSVYKYVTIGSQVWMAENLNYKTTSGSWCYGDDPANCEIYGRLYDWVTAMILLAKCNTILSTDDIDCTISESHQGICPGGWHIPTNEEWDVLEDYVENEQGCNLCAGNYLKATSGWNNNGNGTDIYGFSALPGGYHTDDGDFFSVGTDGNWWADEGGRLNAYYRQMSYIREDYNWLSDSKSFRDFSVRCVKD